MLSRGFSVADMDKFTVGQLINYIYEFERCQARARGEEVPDLEAKYKQLKNALPLVEERHAAGQISKKQYDDYVATLREWEE